LTTTAGTTEAAACILTVFFWGGVAEASGIALRQQSTSAARNSYAGATAGADDPTYMFFNPAAIAKSKGNVAIGSGWLIYSNAKIKGSASTVAGLPIDGGDGETNEFFLLPNFAVTTEVLDGLTLGINLASPYGLGTIYGNSWEGRYHATDSQLFSAEVMPTLAYEVTQSLTVAGGLRVLYVDASLENAVDFGTIGTVVLPLAGGPVVLGGTDGFTKLKADDFGIGFSLGAIWQVTPSTKLGVSYRSRTDLTLEGDATLNTAGNPVNDTIAGAIGLSSMSVEADLTLPQSVRFGVHHQLTPEWSIAADVEWTDWSSVDRLEIVSSSTGAVVDTRILEWEDSFAFSIGTTYRADENWAFRFGVMYDQSPVPDSTRGPIVPDTDRIMLGLGAEYALSNSVSVIAGYQFAYFLPGDIELSAADNPTAGNFEADIRSMAHLMSVGLRISF
jgi:long-chain fatty acid transport protein